MDRSALVRGARYQLRMSTALSRRDTFQKLETYLRNNQKAIERVLPKAFDPERMVSFAMAAVTRRPELLKCTPHSIMLALQDAAYYALEPNPVLGLAYIVPYENKQKGTMEAQFQIGYKGLITLGRRSGLGVPLHGSVYEGDEFAWRPHEQPPFMHVVNLDSPRVDGMIRYVYCFYRVDGVWVGQAFNRTQIERYRQMSSARDKFAWTKHWGAMALKTAIRRVIGRLPLDPEGKINAALSQDQALEMGSPIRSNEVIEKGLPPFDPDTGEVFG